MPGSTYSSNLKIELMTTGENSGTWGDITNTNLGTALEQAVVGYGNVDYVSDANLTISITNSNAAQPARALVLNVTSTFGSLTQTRELVVPTIQKQYIVQNNTTGGQSITVKTSAGTGITVPNGRKAHLYVNGTDVIQMFDFVNLNGGTIDNMTIGATTASSGKFTTLNASGATTLDGTVALGNAAGDLITVPGTINSNLIFTDNTYDIGASGATRPRNLFLAGAATIGGNLSVGGTLTLTGGVNLNGNVTVGDSAADTLTINATITSNLLFTDNTYDIGASGATRPRNLFLAGNITAGGSQTLTGALTVDSTTDSSSTTTGSIQTDGGVGIAKALFVGTTGTFGGALFTQSLAIGNARVQIRDNSIEEYSTNADSLIAVNYTGYLGGTTRFRDFDIYNGKSGFIATFEGSTGRFGLGNANPSYAFDMVGQGRVLATGGTSGATIPSNNLFVVDSNANTGFGVAIPSTGNIVGGFYVNAGTNQYDGGIDYQGTTRALNLRSAGASRVIVDSAGSVGVGAAPTSSGRLSLQITDAAEGYYLSNVRTALGVNFVYNSNNLYIGSNYASYFELDGTSGAFKWFNAPTGTAGNVATFTQTMTLDTNGVAYIGGTSGIGSRLNLIKDTNSTVENLLWLRNSGTGYKGARITFGEYSTINGYITNQYISSGPTWCTDIGSTNSVRFFTGSDPGTQRVIINSAGNVGIGLDNPSSSLGPGLHIATASGNSLILQKSSGAAMQFRTDETTIRATISGFNGADGIFIAYGASQTQTAVFNAYGMGLGSASPSSGVGIAFQPTASLSSNANTLDDYEEGSWTPDLQFGGAKVGITYVYQSGNYVKIGRQVTVWATIYLSSKGSSTGDAQLFGLPYAPSNTFYNEQHGVTGEINSLTFSGYLAARVGGSNQVQVFQNISGSAQTILNNGNFTNGTSLAVTITYTTNA